jgi:uncharacterized OB-fold protein
MFMNTPIIHLAIRYDDCPICTYRWYDLKDSYDVCERHLDWLVTICENCGRLTYSSAAGMCPQCFDVVEEVGELIEEVEAV